MSVYCCIILIIILIVFFAALGAWFLYRDKSAFDYWRHSTAINLDYFKSINFNNVEIEDFKNFINTTKVREEGNYRLYFYSENNDCMAFELIRREVEMNGKLYNAENKMFNDESCMDYGLCNVGTYMDHCVIYYKFRYSGNDFIFIVDTKHRIATLSINDSNIVIFNKRIQRESTDTLKLL